MKLTQADQLFDDPLDIFEDPSQPRQRTSSPYSWEGTISARNWVTPEADRASSSHIHRQPASSFRTLSDAHTVLAVASGPRHMS